MLSGGPLRHVGPWSRPSSPRFAIFFQFDFYYDLYLNLTNFLHLLFAKWHLKWGENLQVSLQKLQSLYQGLGEGKRASEEDELMGRVPKVVVVTDPQGALVEMPLPESEVPKG